MVDDLVRIAIRKYLEAARAAGIRTRRGALFGSHARGEADEWSDIDLVVISPDLDGDIDRETVARLWELRAHTDSRIEPVACGEVEWEHEDSRPIIEVARREGIIIEI